MKPEVGLDDVRADFFQTLARAFAPPIGEAIQRAFVEVLPDDLAAMSGILGYPTGDAIAALRAGMPEAGQSAGLLQIYSGLFLTPPAPVHLNTAVYLDGALLGGSEYEMRQWYARHSLSGTDRASSLADHVEVNLGFVGELFRRASDALEADDPMEALAQAAEARRFLAAYPRRWLPSLRTACATASRERGYPGAYVELLDVLAAAIDIEVVRDVARTATLAVDNAYPLGSSRGVGEPNAEDLAEIAFRLRASGLTFDHVRARPQWRDDVFERRLTDDGPLASSVAARQSGKD